MLLQRRLQGGRGLEFLSVTQPVATGRTTAYHVGADVFVCLYALANYMPTHHTVTSSDLMLSREAGHAIHRHLRNSKNWKRSASVSRNVTVKSVSAASTRFSTYRELCLQSRFQHSRLLRSLSRSMGSFSNRVPHR